MLLRRATHCTKEQIKELIAEIAPKPDVPSSFRKLPDSPRKNTNGNPAPPGPDRVGLSSTLLGPDRVNDSSESLGPDWVEGEAPDPALSGPDRVTGRNALGPDRVESGSGAGGQPSPPPKRPVIEPLSPARYKVQFTAGAELRDKLERLRALMRSSVPDGDIGAIIETSGLAFPASSAAAASSDRSLRNMREVGFGPCIQARAGALFPIQVEGIKFDALKQHLFDLQALSHVFFDVLHNLVKFRTMDALRLETDLYSL